MRGDQAIGAPDLACFFSKSHAPQSVHIFKPAFSQNNMSALHFFFRFGRTVLVGAPNLAMANSPKDLGLLAGTFLVGLGALEMMLHAFGL
jgi:hypothetical protein